MNRPQTYTVLSGYRDRNDQHWITIKGHTRPYLCDEALPEGASVRLDGGRAVRS